jgi:hypothetical protein
MTSPFAFFTPILYRSAVESFHLPLTILKLFDHSLLVGFSHRMPKLHGFWGIPARPVVLRARPVRATTKADPARPVVLRPGPFRPGKFRELSLQCSRIVFYLFIFYRNICVSGYFYCIIYVFIVLSMFRETFRKFSSLDRGKRQHEA